MSNTPASSPGMDAAASCKTCAFFGQTYKHDIERDEYAYQMGTCSAAPWHRVGGPHVPPWQRTVSMDRDSVRACHVTERPISYPGVF